MKPLAWTQMAMSVLIVIVLTSPASGQDGSDKPRTGSGDGPTTTTVVTPNPVAIDPPPAPPNQDFLTGIMWFEHPSADDFARVYPPVARAQRISGSVTLDCLIGAGGRIACNVLSEEPSGHGFGEAALRLSREFRAGSETRDGIRTAGRRTRIPINFRIE